MRAMLVGNYGVGNFGDEALREYMVKTFSAVQWTVVSARPGSTELPRLPIGLRSFFGTPWWGTVRAIRRSEALVFGGGTLLTDIESVRACVLWGLHALVARVMGVPIVLAFQGIGPFRTRIGERIARRVVAWSVFTSVRDGASMARIASWTTASPILETFDPVFLSFLRHVRPRSDSRVWTIIPRSNSGEAFDRAVVELVRNGPRRPMQILLFQPDDWNERAVAKRLQSLFPRAAVRVVTRLEHVMEAMRQSEYCVCERFHGALAAIAAGVPVTIVAQGEGDKLSQVQAIAAEPSGVSRAKVAAERGEKALSALFSEGISATVRV